jgi:predicted AAA+ superfamily ATPase
MDELAFPIFERLIAGAISTAMKDTPVILLNGPRQCGKTTLVRGFGGRGREYVTLDDDTALAAARSDPSSFVRGFNRVTIDEVQRSPELLRAIKQSVDNDRRPGRFLLTGSADILTLPQVSESLAGRMEILTLLPLSQAEMAGTRPTFLARAFAGKAMKPDRSKPGTALRGDKLVEAVLAGGYPEMLRREEKRRRAWARDYVKAIVQRDVRDIAEVEKIDRLPRLLQVLAHYSGQLTNFNQIGGQLGLDDKTVSKYTGIFEQLFLVQRILPWSENHLSRLIKKPKLHFLDSGLLAAMLGLNAEKIAQDRIAFGPLLETFVLSEVMKQTTSSGESYTLHHYRDKDQDEVDLLVEDGNGSLVGLEVKASATVRVGDFKAIRKVKNFCGARLKLGAVLYDGEQTVQFGDGMFAIPISCLWSE